jgi:hypothetical protein
MPPKLRSAKPAKEIRVTRPSRKRTAKSINSCSACRAGSRSLRSRLTKRFSRFGFGNEREAWRLRRSTYLLAGRVMLNPNQGASFAKIGQAAFNPAHFVPDIGPSPDQMCKAVCSSTPISTAAGSTPLTCILRSTDRMHRTPAAAVARARCAPSATRDAREIRSHAPVHHRDDNSGQQDIGVSNANQF